LVCNASFWFNTSLKYVVSEFTVEMYDWGRGVGSGKGGGEKGEGGRGDKEERGGGKPFQTKESKHQYYIFLLNLNKHHNRKGFYLYILVICNYTMKKT